MKSVEKSLKFLKSGVHKTQKSNLPLVDLCLAIKLGLGESFPTMGLKISPS